jgi:hypothetical protein
MRMPGGTLIGPTRGLRCALSIPVSERASTNHEDDAHLGLVLAHDDVDRAFRGVVDVLAHACVLLAQDGVGPRPDLHDVNGVHENGRDDQRERAEQKIAGLLNLHALLLSSDIDGERGAVVRGRFCVG